MTNQEKLKYLISPEKLFPDDIRIGDPTREIKGNLLGNTKFIDSLIFYVELLRENEWGSKERIEFIQLSRLKNLLSYLSSTSQFWADYFSKNRVAANNLKAPDGLHTLPIFTRKVMAGWGDKVFVTNKNYHQNLSRRYTSGTSGVQLAILTDHKEAVISYLPCVFRNGAFTQKYLREALNRKFIVSLGRTGFGFYFSDFMHLFSTSFSDLDNAASRHAIYERIREFGPTFLVGFASFLSKFSYYIKEDNVNLPIFVIKPTSESIPIEEKIFMKNTLRAELLNDLSCSEAGSIGFECPQNPDKFHLHAERIILEIVDCNGRLLKDGEEGEIVITVLDRTVTPIVRYALGDTGRIISGLCSCGRVLPLFEFQGRRGDEVKLPSGRTVRIISLLSKLMQSGLARKAKQFQIIQKRPDSICLLIIPKKPFDDSYEIKIRLALIELFLEEKVTVDIEYVENIPTPTNGKPQFFVSLSEFQERKL